MLAASMCREVHFTVLPSTLSSTVPRCLFGPPNAKETVELLQEALDMERSKFARRWGVDPRTEDKENCMKIKSERVEKSPRKRSTPYSRQSSIHEFWRSRKIYDTASAKKSMITSSSNDVVMKQSNCVEKSAAAAAAAAAASSPSSSSSSSS